MRDPLCGCLNDDQLNSIQYLHPPRCAGGVDHDMIYYDTLNITFIGQTVRPALVIATILSLFHNVHSLDPGQGKEAIHSRGEEDERAMRAIL